MDEPVVVMCDEVDYLFVIAPTLEVDAKGALEEILDLTRLGLSHLPQLVEEAEHPLEHHATSI
jgi:hypothetical protein